MTIGGGPQEVLCAKLTRRCGVRAGRCIFQQQLSAEPTTGGVALWPARSIACRRRAALGNVDQQVYVLIHAAPTRRHGRSPRLLPAMAGTASRCFRRASEVSWRFPAAYFKTMAPNNMGRRQMTLLSKNLCLSGCLPKHRTPVGRVSAACPKDLFRGITRHPYPLPRPMSVGLRP
jgi:hypothetical protein